MAVFCLKPRIFRTLGQNGVLWEQSKLTLGLWVGSDASFGGGRHWEPSIRAQLGHCRCIIIALYLITASTCLQHLYNMQLWAVLLRISVFRLLPMHY